VAATASASGTAAAIKPATAAQNVAASIGDKVRLLPITVTGKNITFRQIIAEALFYQSLFEITRDMIEAGKEADNVKGDLDQDSINSFRSSYNALQEAYAIVQKEIFIKQFQTAFLVNTITVVSMATGAGELVLLGRGIIKLGYKYVINRQVLARTLCFVAGTKVHTKDGLKNIEDIQVGDLVLSKDEKTGKIDYKKVKQLFRNKDKQIYNLTIINQDGKIDTIGTTDEHPFWVDGKGWVNAKDLKLSDKLTSANGKTIKVISIVLDDKRQDTYNFEVADYHTYFVGDDGVWVHNMCLPQINKVTFAKLPHAIGQGVERGVFTNPQAARNTLKELGKTIKSKGFPEGSFWDPSKIDTILVPTGNKGLAVFRVFENGSAKIRTVLNVR